MFDPETKGPSRKPKQASAPELAENTWVFVRNIIWVRTRTTRVLERPRHCSIRRSRSDPVQVIGKSANIDRCLARKPAGTAPTTVSSGLLAEGASVQIAPLDHPAQNMRSRCSARPLQNRQGSTGTSGSCRNAYDDYAPRDRKAAPIPPALIMPKEMFSRHQTWGSCRGNRASPSVLPIASPATADESARSLSPSEAQQFPRSVIGRRRGRIRR